MNFDILKLPYRMNYCVTSLFLLQPLVSPQIFFAHLKYHQLCRLLCNQFSLHVQTVSIEVCPESFGVLQLKIYKCIEHSLLTAVKTRYLMTSVSIQTHQSPETVEQLQVFIGSHAQVCYILSDMLIAIIIIMEE